jgi:hypothetical protein
MHAFPQRLFHPLDLANEAGAAAARIVAVAMAIAMAGGSSPQE